MTGRILVAAVAAAALVVTILVPYLRHPPGSTPSHSTENHEATAPVIVADGSYAELGPVVNPAHPLQNYLLSVPGPPRDSVLLSIIRDAGFFCGDMVSAMQMVDEIAAWRIACTEAQAYVLEIDSFGGLEIEPISYAEGPGPYQLERSVIVEPDSVRPPQ